MKHVASILLFSWIFYVPSSLAGGFIADMLKDIGAINAETAKALDEAHENLGKPLDHVAEFNKSTDPEWNRIANEIREEAQRRKVEIEVSIKVAEEKLNEANVKLKQVSVLTEELNAEKVKLENEKAKLENEKGSLENREQLFSMGFYASLTTTLIAVLGLIVGLPNSRLDKRLKELEIEQKIIELNKAKETVA